MIHFECENCGGPVRVGDEWAGRRGRCPNCRQIITIPAGAGETEDPTEALSTVLRGRSEPTVPPPPQVREQETEDQVDIDAEMLTPQRKDPAEETDVIPHETMKSHAARDASVDRSGARAVNAPASPGRSSAPPRRPEERRRPHPLPTLPRRTTLLVGLILVITLALIAVAWLILRSIAG